MSRQGLSYVRMVPILGAHRRDRPQAQLMLSPARRALGAGRVFFPGGS